uniref:Uncharacterized protein n=4 Tax=Boreoeutheria TaxID=1437010 RepID=A0A8C6RCJ7_NANGA
MMDQARSAFSNL